jgi:hypothetical protein
MSPEKPEIANTAKKTQRGAGFASVTPAVAGAGVVELMSESPADRAATHYVRSALRRRDALLNSRFSVFERAARGAPVGAGLKTAGATANPETSRSPYPW